MKIDECKIGQIVGSQHNDIYTWKIADISNKTITLEVYGILIESQGKPSVIGTRHTTEAVSGLFLVKGIELFTDDTLFEL